VRKFLIWCAGSSPDLLSRCPATDVIRQTILGTFVLLTGLIAGIGALYAFYSTTRSLTASLPCALLWAGLIFTLDRLIITTISPKQTGNTYTVPAWQVLPRALLAILLGISISLPVELFISRDEILKVHLKQQDDRNLENSQKDAASRTLVETEIVRACDLKIGGTQLSSLAKQIENYQLRITTTTLGQDGTGETCGPVCRDLMAQQNVLRKDHAKLDNERTRCISDGTKARELDPEMIRMKSVQLKMRQMQDVSALDPSFFTQYKIFRELSKDNKEIERASFYLPLIFIFFELVPVLAKVLAGVSTYELLKLRESIDSIDDTTEHALRIESNSKNRLDEEVRTRDLLNHQRGITSKLHKTISEETSIYFLSRFQTILPGFDKIHSQSDPASKLDDALLDLLNTKIHSLISLAPTDLPPTLSATKRQEILKDADTNAPKTVHEITHWHQPDDIGGEAVHKRTIKPNPPAAPPLQPTRINFAKSKVTKYIESFIKKSLESIAGKSPDFISYVFTNSTAFIAGFPAILLGVYSVTGASLFVVFPCVLVAFVIGRRVASASQTATTR
jgi:Domain of unknown function (DUF4407)